MRAIILNHDQLNTLGVCEIARERQRLILVRMRRNT